MDGDEDGVEDGDVPARSGATSAAPGRHAQQLRGVATLDAQAKPRDEARREAEGVAVAGGGWRREETDGGTDGGEEAGRCGEWGRGGGS